jgi:hypothetical protein
MVMADNCVRLWAHSFSAHALRSRPVLIPSAPGGGIRRRKTVAAQPAVTGHRNFLCMLGRGMVTGADLFNQVTE